MGASINEGKNFLMKMKNTNNFCFALPLLCIDKTKIEKLCSVKEIFTKYNIVLIIIQHKINTTTLDI